MNKTLFTTAVIFAAISCNSTKIEDRSVTLTADDGTKVRVTAVQDNIIRVSAVPKGEKFSDNESLMTVPVQYNGTPNIEVHPDYVNMVTDSVSVMVSRSDGKVLFYSPEGEIITQEDSRSFSPIEVDGVKAFTVRQIFDSPQDEAFFGLGQHQADEWNYKGRNEDLYQYNTKISIPFIVSSKHYGILWDSNSFCRWGDPREYAQLCEVFRLYDKDGKEGALTGTYTPREGKTLVRRETALNQEYLRTPECDAVMNAPDFDFSGSHVVFEGELEPARSGLFHFYLYYAGYTKVMVGGETVIPEIWRTAWNPNGRKFELNMKAGKKTPIRIEWEPDGDVSYCALKVLDPIDPQLQGQMSWWGEMQKQIDYYFISGSRTDDVISGYRTLTGKAQIMPKWALGYWQSFERYKSQDEILGVLSNFRKRNIPIDNIVQDWQYWKPDQWGSHEFDKERYPDPQAMVDSIHAMNGRYMISVWPKFYTNTEHFKELDENGWMYQGAIRDSVEDWLGHQQSFYDAYAPGARKLFWEQMREHLYCYGVDAWWMDASEPNVHDCTDMDYRKYLCGPTYLGPSTQYFNAYALMNAQAIYEGQRSCDNDTRVFLLTRNGFAGLQRYSTASWSGDISTRWEEMKAQISAGLNYSISGIPFWGQDIGGFTVENRFMRAQSLYNSSKTVNEDLREWRELNARWHEWGAFTPLYRSHGQWPEREPWRLDPENGATYKAITESIRMRYRLMPYIYTMAAMVHFDDYTIMRALVMDFPNDKQVTNISDEYMFGNALLVCPVYEYGARSRDVYLPSGCGWYDAHSFKYYDGGNRITAEAPYEHIPLFWRSGQIVPMGQDIQSTAESQDELTIEIFGGKNASYTLYEDEGNNYGYEQGLFSTIPMTWDETNRTFTVGPREGSFPGMKENRTFKVRLTSAEGRGKLYTIEYNGSLQSIKI